MLKENLGLFTDYRVLLDFIQMFSWGLFKLGASLALRKLLQKSSFSAAQVTVETHCTEVFHPLLLGWD